MRPPSPQRDRAWREAERRGRRHVGHRRLAVAVGLLVLLLLGIGLGVGLGGRGGGTGASTTGSSVSASSTTTGSTTTAVTGATSSTGTTGTAGPQAQVFQAKLTGDSEVPPVTTSATGTLTLTVAADLSKVDYAVEVKDLHDLTVARLHEGKVGQVGDTIITLYPGPTKTGAFTGVVKRGTFTAADLTSPLAGKKISELVALLKSGSRRRRQFIHAVRRRGTQRRRLAMACSKLCRGRQESLYPSTPYSCNS